MRADFDRAEGGGPERIGDAYVDNLRERFSKDHIYVSTCVPRSLKNRGHVQRWKDEMIREVAALFPPVVANSVCLSTYVTSQLSNRAGLPSSLSVGV